MKTVIVSKEGNYMLHGTGNDQGGYFGTSDNGWSYKAAIRFETLRLAPGEQYKLKVNGKDKGIFTNS